MMHYYVLKCFSIVWIKGNVGIQLLKLFFYFIVSIGFNIFFKLENGGYVCGFGQFYCLKWNGI